uniref:Uncharacterized protein n=1 Tax=Aegilops tauschii TaxID=37682 RepID=M8AJP9_AEGTA
MAGPYYHGNSSLQFMGKVKWNYLDYVLKLNSGKKLEAYLTIMESLEKQARSCYSEEVSLESDMFLRMLLLDGCFVLVYLGGTAGLDWCVNEQSASGSNYQGEEPLQYTIAQPEEIIEHASTEGVELEHISRGEQCNDQKDPDQPKCDPISEWQDTHAFRDLLLLENQLPFSIVKRIYGLLVGDDAVDLLTKKVRKYLELYIQKYTTIARNISYKFLSDTELMATSEAGIEFKRKEHNKHNQPSLLDITFDKGEVEIPCLLIDENTICLFRNFVAFEQTCSQFGNDVTSYITFMSQLVSTPCDVALLARKGIILHHMRTDEEVSTHFSKLGKNADFDQNGAHYLKSVCCMMEEYYQNRVNRWMAWLWHNHLKNPWLVLAVVAAAIVLF